MLICWYAEELGRESCCSRCSPFNFSVGFIPLLLVGTNFSVPTACSSESHSHCLDLDHISDHDCEQAQLRSCCKKIMGHVSELNTP